MELKLTIQEKEGLRLLQRGTKERWLYVRVTSVLMVSEGFSVAQVCLALGVDDNTVYRACQNYRSNRPHFLSQDYGGHTGKLSFSRLSKLRSALRGRLFTSARQVCSWAKDAFGVEYTPEGMCRLLKRIGFSYKKTKQVPCEAVPAKQEAFLDGLGALLADQGKEVYFADAVHPTHNTRSLNGWIETGKDFELPTVSGRDRVNINGAVNAKTPSKAFFMEGECINAQNTQALYEKLLAAHPDKDIVVICDNARYYRNAQLQQWLQGKRIVQLFLPPYSPNLNIAERLWKFLRAKAIDPVFYRTKEAFRAGVLSFLENIAQHEQELKSLLALNFRVFGSGKSYSFV